MDWKFYVKKSYFSGFIFLSILVWFFSNSYGSVGVQIFSFLTISCIFFPFAVYTMQYISLKISKHRYWDDYFFINPNGGSILAIYYLVVLIFSIPLFFIFIFFVYRKATS